MVGRGGGRGGQECLLTGLGLGGGVGGHSNGDGLLRAMALNNSKEVDIGVCSQD